MDAQQAAPTGPATPAEAAPVSPSPGSAPDAAPAKPLGVVLLALAFSGQITELITELQPADATTLALALGWAYVIEGGLALIVAYGFLAKILQKLVKAKIVRSYRGVKGGFSLARQAKEISVLDVLEAIEGKLTINICLADKKKCDFSRHCPIHSVWANVQVKVTDVHKKSNFDDLARQRT